ncbi:MAG TPA: hypothetical protein VNE41_00315 [Chitinophagaceae bacterium]|nr:hypothetical protein [Chitinophagaceae bacterium]
MTSVERVLEYIRYKRLSKRFFYKNTGISNGYLDKVKDLGANKMEKIISAFPELNFEWLVTGSGPMIRELNLKPPEGNIREKEMGYQNLQELLQEKEKLIEAKDRVIAAQDATIRSNTDLIALLKNQNKDLRRG